MMKESQGCRPIVIHLGSEELMKFLFHSRLTLFQMLQKPQREQKWLCHRYLMIIIPSRPT